MTEEPEDSRPDEDDADVQEDGPPPVTEAGGDYEQEEPRSTADEPGDPGREA